MPAWVDTFIAEIEFTPTVWTDVSAWVNVKRSSVDWQWGRASVFESTSAGSCSIQLDNTDGRFTPNSAVLTTGAANPYYPNVVERKQIRVRTTHSAVTRQQWIGRIDSWAASFAGGNSGWSQVVVTASDRFKDFSRRVMADLQQEQARLYGPISFWPLASGSATATVDVVSGQNAAIKMPSDNTGAHAVFGPGPVSTSGGLRFSSNNLSYTAPALRFRRFGGGLRQVHSFWALLEDGGNDAETLLIGPEYLVMYQQSTGGLRMQILVGTGGSGFVDVPTATLVDGAWHHYLVDVVLNGSGALTQELYLDGADIGTCTSAAGCPTVFADGVLSLNNATSGGKPLGNFTNTQFSSLGVFDGSGFGSSTTLQVAVALAGTGAPVTVTNRLAQVLALCGVAPSEYALDTCNVLTSAADAQGVDALSYLQSVVQAGSGVLDAHSLVTFAAPLRREPDSAALAAAVVFDAGNDVDADSIVLTLADDLTATRVTASSPVGDVVADAGLTPVLTDSIDAPWYSLDDTEYAAQARLMDRQAARLRFSSISVEPTTATTDRWPAVLALQLSDLIKVTGLNPATCGGRSQAWFFVEGVHPTMNLDRSQWQLDTSLWDRDHAAASFDDTLTGRFTSTLGSHTVGTVGCLSGTGTGTFTIVTPSGPLWTVVGGDFPLNVKIEEEELTLSGITGGSSPQTATVSVRGVNGTVATAHVTGKTVDLYPVPVFAL